MEPALLRQVDLFAPLSDEELSQVAQVMKLRAVPKGALVVVADEPGPTLFALFRGEAKVAVQGSDGKEFLITLLEPGEIFGELSVLTGEERSANVAALTDCQLGSISSTDFEQLLDTIPRLSRSLIKILALRLRASSAKLSELALLDVTERVKQTLLSLADTTGKETVVEQRPTHQMLASMVGTSREMVTRALSLLEEAGEIRTEGKKVYFRS